MRRLKLKWHVHLNGSGTGSKYKGEGTPLVYKGIMYIVTGAGDVFALDATNGTILWQYSAQSPAGDEHGVLRLGEPGARARRRQGLRRKTRRDARRARAGDRPCRLDVSNGNWQDGYTMTMAPLYYNGLVIVGVSGGEYGARGYVTAYDARDGHLVWRFYTIPSPGQPGAATWPPEQRVEDRRRTVWNTPSVDPKTGLLYFTTGNAFPWSGRGPGDNLFTASFVALNPMTGAYAWHYQVVHHDIWDYDCASNTVLFATGIGGRVRKVVAEPCKTGWVYELDRRNGSPVVALDEKPVPQSSFQHTSPTQPIPAGDNFSEQCAQPKRISEGGRRRVALPVRLRLHAVRPATVHRGRARSGRRQHVEPGLVQPEDGQPLRVLTRHANRLQGGGRDLGLWLRRQAVHRSRGVVPERQGDHPPALSPR